MKIINLIGPNGEPAIINDFNQAVFDGKREPTTEQERENVETAKRFFDLGFEEVEDKAPAATKKPAVAKPEVKAPATKKPAGKKDKAEESEPEANTEAPKE